MRNKFYTLCGRAKYLEQLNKSYVDQAASLTVLYGRRRIGKTFLLKEFIKDKPHLFFEGIEGGKTPQQLQQLASQLYNQTQNPLLQRFNPKNWNEFLDTLLLVIPNDKKFILVFDEFQWLAAGRSLLVSLFKIYWDNQFKNRKLQIILCGSIAHFMVKKVIKSKALYGRISSELHMTELLPQEARQMLAMRGSLEALNYLLTFGGVPKYLEEIEINKSFEQNIESLYFSRTSFFYNEIEKIFFSQFKESKTYQRIVLILSTAPHSLEELAKKLKMASGGGLKDYLHNLELAQFVLSYRPMTKKSTKTIKYKLTDEYLRFYYRFIRPYKKQIDQDRTSGIFATQVKTIWKPWFGFAFENFCFKNALVLAEKMGFAEYVKDFGPYYASRDSASAQFDLVYTRTDSVMTICEIKYAQSEIEMDVVLAMQEKLLILGSTELTIEKVLVTTVGVSAAVKESRFFHHVMTLKEIFE